MFKGCLKFQFCSFDIGQKAFDPPTPFFFNIFKMLNVKKNCKSIALVGSLAGDSDAENTVPILMLTDLGFKLSNTSHWCWLLGKRSWCHQHSSVLSQDPLLITFPRFLGMESNYHQSIIWKLQLCHSTISVSFSWQQLSLNISTILEIRICNFTNYSFSYKGSSKKSLF